MARGALFVLLMGVFLVAALCEASDAVCGSRGAASEEFGLSSMTRRRLLEDANRECSAIATKDLCSKVDYCKWCRSELLDDTCFGVAESARLPRTIFLCSDVS